MQLDRRAIRYVAAASAAAMAAIYYLIGLGVLSVVRGQGGDGTVDLFAFGAMAGSGFLLGAILLAVMDRRVLWILGAILQVLVFLAYLNVAPQRDPPFEIWGITLRVLQVPLFLALMVLAVRAPEPGAAGTTTG